MRAFRLALSASIALLAIVLPASASAITSENDVRKAAAKLVKAEGGPPGVIVTLHRSGQLTTIAEGRRDIKTPGAPSAGNHMRIASITKAYTGVIILRLVAQERIALDDTVGLHLPSMPLAWHGVTIRQLMNHTSGVPDYTKSAGFMNQFQTAPTARVSPQTVISWVSADPLVFPSGSKYEYSNTDNIILALIAEETSGRSYPDLLKTTIFTPLNLTATSLPTTTELPRRTLYGYVPEDDGKYTDVTSLLSPSGAWASGGIESTPRELGKFMRALLSKQLVTSSAQRQQLKWVEGGESSPAGPGKNSAGLSIFRYETRCGTVYGHTGNFPGYVQFAAANASGSRSVTTSLNIPAPTGALLKSLREMQTKAVCRLLGK